MHLVTAVIRPEKLEAVKEALGRVGVYRLTVSDVQGYGQEKSREEVYRGHEYTIRLQARVKIEIAVNETFLEPTIEAILEGGRTGDEGEIGDGKIFVEELEDVVRIRTGERGSEAI